MNDSGLIFGLPLLTKDLIEQAARRRTYLLRVIYAVILYGAAFWAYADLSSGGAQAGLSNLGRGADFFRGLVQIQFVAIIVLLPAMSCGAITSEKERDTLGLLLLTQLSPRVIVLEKLLSRLVTMGTYQLLSLPLFAVIYGMGGVELSEMIATIWYLAWCSAVVAAWSIYWSVWHRTTAGAFLAAYAMMPLIVCIGEVCLGVSGQASGELWRTQQDLSALQFTVSLIVYGFVLTMTSIPMALLTLAAVAAAQSQLLARAFVPPRNLLLELFKKLDTFFMELNEHTTRGVILVRDFDTGPLFDPIAWRETRKRSLGTVRYLFRLLVLLEGPLALAISWTMADMQTQSFDGPTSFFLAILWPIAVLAIVVHTTNTMASERSRQTLDVLLVAPLTQSELVTQKLAGVRRLIGVLTVPFATLAFFQAIWTLYVVKGLYLFQQGGSEGVVFIHEILGMVLGTTIYLRVIQWIAFHLALRLKNQTQAVLSSVAVILAICVVPLVVSELYPALDLLAWLSPVRVLFHRQWVMQQYVPGMSVGHFRQDILYLGLISHAIVFVTLWFLLRNRALRDFSMLVGRTEPAVNSTDSEFRGPP